MVGPIVGVHDEQGSIDFGTPVREWRSCDTLTRCRRDATALEELGLHCKILEAWNQLETESEKQLCAQNQTARSSGATFSITAPHGTVIAIPTRRSLVIAIALSGGQNVPVAATLATGRIFRRPWLTWPASPLLKLLAGCRT
jgi:hypothetical protein